MAAHGYEAVEPSLSSNYFWDWDLQSFQPIPTAAELDQLLTEMEEATGVRLLFDGITIYRSHDSSQLPSSYAMRNKEANAPRAPLFGKEPLMALLPKKNRSITSYGRVRLLYLTVSLRNSASLTRASSDDPWT